MLANCLGLIGLLPAGPLLQDFDFSGHLTNFYPKIFFFKDMNLYVLAHQFSDSVIFGRWNSRTSLPAISIKQRSRKLE